MLRNLLIGIFAAILVVALGTAAYSVMGAQTQGAAVVPAAGNGSGYGYGSGGQGAPQSTGSAQDHAAELAAIPVSDLSAEEAASLLYMYEEEKLARDVYNVLYAAWNLPTFQNIAASEQMHMDSVKSLLDRCGLTAPALAPGQFADASLQNLYTTLTAQGGQSAAQALKVGAAIEELDILDLQTRLTQTDNADIQMVYNNLLNGSSNHLKAFAGALQNQTGESYVPQWMSAEQYAAVLSSVQGNGYAGGNGNGNGNGNGSGNGTQGGGRQGAAGNGSAAGNHGANGSGIPQAQANLTAASTLRGTVSAYAYGTLTLVTTDGQTVGVQLGSQRYVSSLGFAPQIGEQVTVYGFPGDQGLFSAITVTLQNGQVFTFRESTGRPAWAGGNGKGGH